MDKPGSYDGPTLKAEGQPDGSAKIRFGRYEVPARIGEGGMGRAVPSLTIIT